MKQITFLIQKSGVMLEIAKTTAYIGAKTPGEAGTNSYDKVFTTNDDDVMLERFFREAKTIVTDHLKAFLVDTFDINDDTNVVAGEVFKINLSVTDRYVDSMTTSINNLIFSFFVNHITYKWFAITNRPDMQYYATESAGNLKDIHTKLYFKRKPNQNLK